MNPLKKYFRIRKMIAVINRLSIRFLIGTFLVLASVNDSKAGNLSPWEIFVKDAYKFKINLQLKENLDLLSTKGELKPNYVFDLRNEYTKKFCEYNGLNCAACKDDINAKLIDFNVGDDIDPDVFFPKGHDNLLYVVLTDGRVSSVILLEYLAILDQNEELESLTEAELKNLNVKDVHKKFKELQSSNDFDIGDEDDLLLKYQYEQLIYDAFTESNIGSLSYLLHFKQYSEFYQHRNNTGNNEYKGSFISTYEVAGVDRTNSKTNSADLNYRIIFNSTTAFEKHSINYEFSNIQASCNSGFTKATELIVSEIEQGHLVRSTNKERDAYLSLLEEYNKESDTRTGAAGAYEFLYLNPKMYVDDTEGTEEIARYIYNNDIPENEINLIDAELKQLGIFESKAYLEALYNYYEELDYFIRIINEEISKTSVSTVSFSILGASYDRLEEQVFGDSRFREAYYTKLTETQKFGVFKIYCSQTAVSQIVSTLFNHPTPDVRHLKKIFATLEIDQGEEFGELAKKENLLIPAINWLTLANQSSLYGLKFETRIEALDHYLNEGIEDQSMFLLKNISPHEIEGLHNTLLREKRLKKLLEEANDWGIIDDGNQIKIQNIFIEQCQLRFKDKISSELGKTLVDPNRAIFYKGAINETDPFEFKILESKVNEEGSHICYRDGNLVWPIKISYEDWVCGDDPFSTWYVLFISETIPGSGFRKGELAVVPAVAMYSIINGEHNDNTRTAIRIGIDIASTIFSAGTLSGVTGFRRIFAISELFFSVADMGLLTFKKELIDYLGEENYNSMLLITGIGQLSGLGTINATKLFNSLSTKGNQLLASLKNIKNAPSALAAKIKTLIREIELAMGRLGVPIKNIQQAGSLFKVGDNIIGKVIQKVRPGTNGKIAVIGRRMPGHVEDVAAALKAEGKQVEIFSELDQKNNLFNIDGVNKSWDDIADDFKNTNGQYLTSNGKILDSELPKTMMYKANKIWVDKLKAQGYTVIDMGYPVGQNLQQSVFYNMELSNLFP